MARQFRVCLTPIAAEASTETRLLFLGAVLSLETFGAGASVAKLSDPVSAKITLEAKFADRVREPSQEETLTLGTLAGRVELVDTGIPRFHGNLDDEGEPEGLVPDPSVDESGDGEDDEGKSRRVLTFRYDPNDFDDVPRESETLVVKIDVSRFRFMEVRAKLEIDGSTEADFPVNDVLDVGITAQNPPPFPEPIEVQVTDELGAPVAGATVSVHAGGKTIDGQPEGPADGDGVIHLQPDAGAESLTISWNTTVGPVKRQIFVNLGSGRTASERRLHNMGFFEGPELADDVLSFQREFDLEDTGRLADIEDALKEWHDDGVLPTKGQPKPVSNEPVAFSGPKDSEDLSDGGSAVA